MITYVALTGKREEVHAAARRTETERRGARIHVPETHIRSVQPRGQERL